MTSQPLHVISRTWRLWRRLKEPPTENPLFQYVAQMPRYRSNAALWGVGMVVIFYIVASVIFEGAPQRMNTSRYVMGLTLLFPILLVLFTFSGTAYGIGWVMRVSRILYQVRQGGLLDLIVLTPVGTQNALWLVAMGALHQDQIMERLPESKLPAHPRTLWILLGIVVLFLLIPQSRATMSTLSITLVVLGFIFIDYVHACETAVLIGLLAALRATSEELAWFWGVMGFLGVQLATYLVMGVVVVWLTPLLLDTRWPLFGLPYLLLFYLLRELLIPLLLRSIHRAIEGLP